MTYFTGIDIGSRFVKIVIKNNKNFEKIRLDTALFYKKFTKIKEGQLVVDFAKLKIPSENVCSTGYGRNNVNISGSMAINEIKAHTWGIFRQTELTDFTLIDIGGQDVKVIKVTNGYIDDFVMNDKCAASTGRFIENISKTLDVSLDYLSEQTENPIAINSTCAIFGETEIIGKLAEGIDIKNICSGINYTLAKRITGMLNNIFTPPLVVSGGVAKNRAIIHFFKKILEIEEVLIPKEAQFNGAIGCIHYLQTIKKAP